MDEPSSSARRVANAELATRAGSHLRLICLGHNGGMGLETLRRIALLVIVIVVVLLGILGIRQVVADPSDKDLGNGFIIQDTHPSPSGGEPGIPSPSPTPRQPGRTNPQKLRYQLKARKLVRLR